MQKLEQREEGVTTLGSRASMWTLTTDGVGRVHWSLLLQGLGVVTTSGHYMERAGETRKSGSLFSVMAPAYLLMMYREATLEIWELEGEQDIRHNSNSMTSC